MVRQNLNSTAVQKKLEAELQARDEFFSAIAHELRNPLNALHLTVAGLLRAHGGAMPLSSEQVVARLNRASTQVSRLAKLVDDMLDVSRISAGRLILQLDDFDASTVLAEVVERAKDPANASLISLSMPPSLLIRGDRTRFAQIASNLLSNAIVYGLQRPIEVRLDSDNSTIRLEVVDHGIGIAEADQQRIFERFVKLAKDDANVRFGIGLWITRAVVRALKGDIHVASQPDRGSTFVVKLPKLDPAGTPVPSE
jgi:signal transduction histidine kinase